MAAEARKPSSPLLTRLLVGSAGLGLITLAFLYRWQVQRWASRSLCLRPSAKRPPPRSGATCPPPSGDDSPLLALVLGLLTRPTNLYQK